MGPLKTVTVDILEYLDRYQESLGADAADIDFIRRFVSRFDRFEIDVMNPQEIEKERRDEPIEVPASSSLEATLPSRAFVLRVHLNGEPIEFTAYSVSDLAASARLWAAAFTE